MKRILFIQAFRNRRTTDADIASAVDVLRGCPGIDVSSIELPDAKTASLFRGALEAVRQRVLRARMEDQSIDGVIGAGVPEGWIHGVARALRCRAIRLLTADDRARGDRAGIDPFRYRLLALVDDESIDRAQARATIGARPDDRVVLVPGRVTRDSIHARALHAMSMLYLNDARFRMLTPARGDFESLIARAERRGSSGLMIAGDTDDMTLARAADVVLHDAADAGERMPLLYALRDAFDGLNRKAWVRVRATNRAGSPGRSWWPGADVGASEPKSIARAILDVEQSAVLSDTDASIYVELFAGLSRTEATQSWIDLLRQYMNIKESAA